MKHKKASPGKVLLQAAGIMMIIFGAGSLGLLGVGLSCGLTGAIETHTAFMMCGMGLVGVLQFIAGIVGVRNCGKLEKASTCFVWGIIAVVCAMIGIILCFMMEQSWSAFKENRNIYAFLFVFPILYLIGAVWNRHAAIRAAK